MDNAAIYRKLSKELFVDGRLDALDRFLHPDYRVSDPSYERGQGAAGNRRAMQAILEAFSDIGYEVLHQVASDDWVATHFRFSGINRRPFAGLSSPGTRMSVEGMSMNRFLDGKVVEGHVVWDMAGMARQLGGFR